MTTVALVHGLGGSASTMTPLADALRAAGLEVIVETLPGHGTSPDDLVGVGWDAWVDAVPRAEVVVGQSMGASLALAAAAADARVRAVVAINPPTADEDALDGLEWRRSRGHAWLDAPQPAEGEIAYSRLPIDAVIAMVRGIVQLDPAAVLVPVVLVHGVFDDTADPAALDALAAQLGGPITRLVLPASGHVATFGPDLALLVAAVESLTA